MEMMKCVQSGPEGKWIWWVVISTGSFDNDIQKNYEIYINILLIKIKTLDKVNDCIIKLVFFFISDLSALIL